MAVFITGATAGFGLALTEKLVESGNSVIASGRRSERLEALKKKFGKKIHIITLDVRDKDAVFSRVKELEDPWSEIDVLINNAGLALGLESAQKADIDDWHTMVDTNIKGVLNCTTAILPGMVKRNKGHIINLGSVAGEFPYPGGNVYGASKAFVHQFSLNLRADLLGTAVRVTCIEPGLCGGTEFSEVRFHNDKKKAEAVYAGVKSISAADVAEAVLWVMSRPAHVNINVISMMPVGQAWGPFAIDRKL